MYENDSSNRPGKSFACNVWCSAGAGRWPSASVPDIPTLHQRKVRKPFDHARGWFKLAPRMLADTILLAGGVVLHDWIALVLFHHRTYRQFPFFFIYNAYAALAHAGRLVAFLVAFYVPGTYYFNVYWWTELFLLLLAIAATHEAFRSVFEGFYLLPWFRWAYFGGISIVLISSILNSIFNRPHDVHPFFRIVLNIGIPVNCILAAISVLFYISAKLLRVGFRRHPFSIVLGFGITAVGTLIVFVIRSEFGKKMETFLIYAPNVAYYLAQLIWLSAFYRPPSDSDEGPPPIPPEQMAEEVREYTRALKRLFR